MILLLLVVVVVVVVVGAGRIAARIIGLQQRATTSGAHSSSSSSSRMEQGPEDAIIIGQCSKFFKAAVTVLRVVTWSPPSHSSRRARVNDADGRAGTMPHQPSATAKAERTRRRRRRSSTEA
jgi:hypothetical protein